MLSVPTRLCAYKRNRLQNFRYRQHNASTSYKCTLRCGGISWHCKITKQIFGRNKIEFIVILALAGCIQPVLFCTFVYGNIIGMCCAIWASHFLIKYFQTDKYLVLIPCGVLLVVSALAKYNNLIYLVAFVIMLIIHTVKAKNGRVSHLHLLSVLPLSVQVIL